MSRDQESDYGESSNAAIDDAQVSGSDGTVRMDVSDTPREEWNDWFRRVVEYFEENRDVTSFESGGRYPHEYDPFVLDEHVRAPLRPGGENEYNWSILFNPWPGGPRDAWIIDGEPLTPDETVHGADDPENDVIATADDTVEIHSHRVVVCVALTKVASFHSRAGTWIHNDDEIEEQFGAVMDQLQDESNTKTP